MTSDLPMNPSEALRELQAIATSHPELAARLAPIARLIDRENSTILAIHQTLRLSRLPEHFG